MSDRAEMLPDDSQAPKREPPHTHVDICVNNPRNGMFEGVLRAIRFPGLELVSVGRVPWIEFIGETIMCISRENFEIVSMTDWVGNWCWNSVKMERHEAQRLFVWLAKKKKWFTPESGNERTMKVWERLASK